MSENKKYTPKEVVQEIVKALKPKLKALLKDERDRSNTFQSSPVGKPSKQDPSDEKRQGPAHTGSLDGKGPIRSRLIDRHKELLGNIKRNKPSRLPKSEKNPSLKKDDWPASAIASGGGKPLSIRGTLIPQRPTPAPTAAPPVSKGEEAMEGHKDKSADHYVKMILSKKYQVQDVMKLVPKNKRDDVLAAIRNKAGKKTYKDGLKKYQMEKMEKSESLSVDHFPTGHTHRGSKIVSAMHDHENKMIHVRTEHGIMGNQTKTHSYDIKDPPKHAFDTKSPK